MQNRRVILILALLILLISTACAQEQAPAVTEAVIESATEDVVPTEAAATSTPLMVRTLPPTWTPSPPAEAENTSDSGGDNSAVATQPAAVENTEPELIAPTALEVCATFGEDLTLNKRTFTPGTPVQIFWTPVEGAASYFITLIDQFGDTVQTDYTSQTTLVYPPELFKANSLYGWEAYPIDPAGRQMCISRGAELLPDNRPGG